MEIDTLLSARFAAQRRRRAVWALLPLPALSRLALCPEATPRRPLTTPRHSGGRGSDLLLTQPVFAPLACGFFGGHGALFGLTLAWVRVKVTLEAPSSPSCLTTGLPGLKRLQEFVGKNYTGASLVSPCWPDAVLSGRCRCAVETSGVFHREVKLRTLTSARRLSDVTATSLRQSS